MKAFWVSNTSLFFTYGASNPVQFGSSCHWEPPSRPPS